MVHVSLSSCAPGNAVSLQTSAHSLPAAHLHLMMSPSGSLTTRGIVWLHPCCKRKTGVVMALGDELIWPVSFLMDKEKVVEIFHYWGNPTPSCKTDCDNVISAQGKIISKTVSSKRPVLIYTKVSTKVRHLSDNAWAAMPAPHIAFTTEKLSTERRTASTCWWSPSPWDMKGNFHLHK